MILTSLAKGISPEWSPSDTIAVVAITASALVAIAAVVLQGYVTRRNARREQKRQDIRELLRSCNRLSDLRLEYVEAAVRSPEGDDKIILMKRMLTEARNLESLVAILNDNQLDHEVTALAEAVGPRLKSALPDRDRVRAVYDDIQEMNGRIQARAADLYRSL